jgi:hypothetical protein
LPETVTPTHKDVKYGGRSDYVYENTWKQTKCTPRKRLLYTEMFPLQGNRQEASRPFDRACTNGVAGAETFQGSWRGANPAMFFALVQRQA